MLAQTGRLAIQRTLSFQGGSSVIRAPFVNGVPFMVQQLRTARRKAPTDFYEKANRDDERLLKRLEAQLVNAKARSKRDEEAALAFQREQMNSRKGPKGKAVVEDDSAFFFNKMLTRMDRAKLAMHGIWNYEQFYLAYMEADALLRRPPFPQLEDLHPKHQIAYELYNKIPEKVTDSTPWGPDHTGAPS